ncbi:hypothetical protein EDEG_00094 [Edhazardia aedis USNM 41457]|uniref:Rho-GAP domain-containing protein n=1 Tax=Edhazardia aedis (strain USNM 41457) TaxID=1003232 RepID=J9DUK1_EDHAE|nr:hypothetical protein EDEG_00094 [Edhazardia aedis USNM 41457]|eukprot:EJW04977.1 hypothetical protein EDEG_00094 [Edhazardia aedis USNM 41457]
MKIGMCVKEFEKYLSSTRSVNNLSDEGFEIYKANFIRKYEKEIRSILIKDEADIISKKSALTVFLKNEPEFKSLVKKDLHTKICYDVDGIMAPREFVILIDTALSMNLQTVGIFRLGFDIYVQGKAFNYFLKMLYNDYDEVAIRDYLTLKCDIHMVTGMIRDMLYMHKGQLVPLGFIEMLHKTYFCGNDHVRFVTITAIYYSIPKHQRVILECLAKFFHIAAEENTKIIDSKHRIMSFRSICAVFVAETMLKNDQLYRSTNYINDLVDVLNYLLEEMKNIVAIKDNLFPLGAELN